MKRITCNLNLHIITIIHSKRHINEIDGNFRIVLAIKIHKLDRVSVGSFICTVDYDYPQFHLTMHTFYCTIESRNLTLLEHEAAKWLNRSELHTVNWLPADAEVVKKLKIPSIIDEL